MKFLTFTDIRKGQLSEIMNQKDKSKFIKDISKAITFNCSIDYSTDICFIEQCYNLFPSKCKYCLVEYSSGSTIQLCDFPISQKIDDVLALFPKLKLWYIMILKQLTDQSYLFICRLLNLDIVKRNLVNVTLVLKNLFQALNTTEFEYGKKNKFITLFKFISWLNKIIKLYFIFIIDCILNLCSECDNIGYIKLDYVEKCEDDEVEQIRKSIKEFTKKYGIITTLNIKIYDGSY